MNNLVTKEINGNMRVVNLVTMLDNTVIKYMKMTFIGNENDMLRGVGNIWIDAYDFDHMTKKLRPRIEFNAENGSELYDIFTLFASDLDGKVVDKADLDYESSFTMESGEINEKSASIVFNYKHGEEVNDEDKARIIIDYQYLDEKVYNAVLNLFCDLQGIAINSKDNAKVIA